ncbi:hypothetical protein M408DRAFT_333247 [Serendipita vermifera MAFF 305830]|uniref:Uncharacterized protein n=1 Tax=Serendipita vermifera MAFF 305830 TaxID=933852 RepID=A0A0C2WWS1_SERVB|nr:hypothetical protein M408DRAFT_333247 [Serendipita vermifera MAFF 305830]
MHSTPMHQSLPNPSSEARFYTASSIASGSAGHPSPSYSHSPLLDSPAHPHVHTSPVWKLVHSHDAIYAPVPPSLIRKRPALPSSHSSSSSTTTSARWYDYDEFNDHSNAISAGPSSRPPSH